MGIETKLVDDAFANMDHGESFLGGRNRKKSMLPYPEKTEFRFFVGCLNNDADRIEYEALLTKSFRCQNVLKNPGDLAVLDMQGAFDKSGQYQVVSRYAILPEEVR